MSDMKSQVATGAAPREISYSFSAKSRAGRTLIRSIENLTGRPKLLRMPLGTSARSRPGGTSGK
jgi:hypothetical protein